MLIIRIILSKLTNFNKRGETEAALPGIILKNYSEKFHILTRKQRRRSLLCFQKNFFNKHL